MLVSRSVHTVDLSGLTKIDTMTKPPGFDTDAEELFAYYDDTARPLVQARNHELGIGLKNNRRPILIGLIKRVVDRLSVVYASQPTRWLRNEMTLQRLPEGHPDHVTMLRTLRLMQANLAWRYVDRIRSLLRSAFIRYVPNPCRRSVTMRIFNPNQVMREVDMGTPDCLETDRRIALRLTGERFEYWENTVDGWIPWWIDKNGNVLENQPLEFLVFDEDGMIVGQQNPYGDTLPIQYIKDDYSAGRAWLPPANSRLAIVEAVNGMANDTWNLLVHQAHQEIFIKTDNPGSIPNTTGPGLRQKVDRDVQIDVVNANTQIAAVQRVLEFFIRLGIVTEELPADEFDPSKKIVTGAAQKVREAPLRQRRENQIPLADIDEAEAWQKIVAVHNVHAPTWMRPMLNPNFELEVEVAEVNPPVDKRELLEAEARSQAMGASSTIDTIQRAENIDRHSAIRQFERVRQDNILYPPMVPMTINDGPRIADIASRQAPDPVTDNNDSVLDAIESSVAARSDLS